MTRKTPEDQQGDIFSFWYETTCLINTFLNKDHSILLQSKNFLAFRDIRSSYVWQRFLVALLKADVIQGRRKWLVARLQGVSDPPPIIKFHDTELVNYNPGKKLVDFLNFQTLSPSPLIQCSYLGDMCCKSTLPEPTVGLVALIEQCSHFHHMFSNSLDVFFEKSTDIFSKIVVLSWILIVPFSAGYTIINCLQGWNIFLLFYVTLLLA
jgi:hypothetical protein